jgi:hypothetical protein
VMKDRAKWMEGEMESTEPNKPDVLIMGATSNNPMIIGPRQLEMRYLWSRVYYSMTNPIKEPNLEQLVQFLGINIKMDGKSRPSRLLVPISPAFVISAMIAPTEETHLVGSSVMKLLINHTWHSAT